MSPIGNVGEAPEYSMVLFLIFANFSRNNQAGGYRNKLGNHNKLRDPSLTPQQPRKWELMVEIGRCGQRSFPKLLGFRQSRVIQLQCDGYPTRKKLFVRCRTKLYNHYFLEDAALES